MTAKEFDSLSADDQTVYTATKKLRQIYDSRQPTPAEFAEYATALGIGFKNGDSGPQIVCPQNRRDQGQLIAKEIGANPALRQYFIDRLGVPAARRQCKCGRKLNDKGQCWAWSCCDMLCVTCRVRYTGSAFIRNCQICSVGVKSTPGQN